MPDTAVAGAGGAGMMLNRRRSKARRRKRKELFGFQICFAGFLLGLVAGLRSVSQKAGEMISFNLFVKREPKWLTRYLCLKWKLVCKEHLVNVDETRDEWWQEVFVDAANPVKSPPNKLLKPEKVSMPWVKLWSTFLAVDTFTVKNASIATNICKWYALSLEMAAVGAAFLYRISLGFGAWLTEYLLMCGNINAALLHHVCCVLDEIEIDKICCFFSLFSISEHFLKTDTSRKLRHQWEPWGAVVKDLQPCANTLSAHFEDNYLLENYNFWPGKALSGLWGDALSGWPPLLSPCN